MSITATEYNILSLFLSTTKSALSVNVFDRTPKLGLSVVADWTTKNIGFDESEIQIISGFTKSVTVKPKINSQHLKIAQCDDSMIYIDEPLKTLCITQCTNCQIFVSSVQFITTISFSDRVQVCLASNSIRIFNTTDSTIYYFGSYSPIIYGDSRSITLAPHNANTSKLFERCKEAQIPLIKSGITKFENPIILFANSAIDWNIMSVDEYQRMVLPEDQFQIVDYTLIQDCNFDLDKMVKEITEKRILSQPITQDVKNKFINYYVKTKIIIPFLAPLDYMKAIFERYKQFANLQAMIKQAQLKNDDMKSLQNAIQGNFREWLNTSSQLKPITELVKLIDQDQL